MSDRRAWSFTDELEFIKGMGKHTPTNRPHMDIVLDYLNALRRRHDWGDLDEARVISACRRELRG